MSRRPLLGSFRHAPKLPPISKSRSYVSSASLKTVSTCPSPTCSCAPTPALPADLPIDRTKPLNGMMPSYNEQVLICTGQSDWKSRIEEENDLDNLAQDLKELLGKGGTYSDPFHNVSILNSSFPSSASPRPEVHTSSAYLLPSFKYIPFLPRVSFSSVEALVKGYLLPKKLHPMHDSLSPIHKDRLRRTEEYQALLYGVQNVQDVLVLICGHRGRDMRCGIMGPVLKSEFQSALAREGLEVLNGAVEIADERNAASSMLANPSGSPSKTTARVGLISHIGGHKFAGNIIIYIPPGAKLRTGTAHPLAGCGIWYGRVEPKHVEGIVNTTVLQGEVIADMFRGGIREGGEILRL